MGLRRVAYRDGPIRLTNEHQQTPRQTSQPPLFGLILAGGASVRMGIDKGTIDYRGLPHARYLHGLLGDFCEHVLVSINSAQRGRDPYAGMAVIVDAVSRRGPASGLLAAAGAYPEKAWLAVAVDLAALTRETLAELVRLRRGTGDATAFRHPDGALEPLCAIWEPSGCAALADRVAAGDYSPRRCLESADVEVLACSAPATLSSVNRPEERDRLLARH